MSQSELNKLLSANSLEQINGWIKKYPSDRKRAALIPALSIIQQEQHYLKNETMAALAEYLEIPKIAVYEVASFYSMFRLKPTGKHEVSLCTNVSCMLAGSEKLKQWFKTELGIAPGQTTSDGLISLKEVECLGACGGAPMCEVDKQYHENLDTEKLAKLMASIKNAVEVKA